MVEILHIPYIINSIKTLHISPATLCILNDIHIRELISCWNNNRVIEHHKKL